MTIHKIYKRSKAEVLTRLTVRLATLHWGRGKGRKKRGRAKLSAEARWRQSTTRLYSSSFNSDGSCKMCSSGEYYVGLLHFIAQSDSMVLKRGFLLFVWLMYHDQLITVWRAEKGTLVCEYLCSWQQLLLLDGCFTRYLQYN